MFEFNFEVNEPDSSETAESPFKKQKSDHKTHVQLNPDKKIDWYQAEQVKPQNELLNSLDLYELNAKDLSIGSIEMRHLIAGFLLEDIKTHSDDDSGDIKKSEESHSDLIAGVYEGLLYSWKIIHINFY